MPPGASAGAAGAFSLTWIHPAGSVSSSERTSCAPTQPQRLHCAPIRTSNPKRAFMSWMLLPTLTATALGV